MPLLTYFHLTTRQPFFPRLSHVYIEVGKKCSSQKILDEGKKKKRSNLPACLEMHLYQDTCLLS